MNKHMEYVFIKNKHTMTYLGIKHVSLYHINLPNLGCIFDVLRVYRDIPDKEQQGMFKNLIVSLVLSVMESCLFVLDYGSKIRSFLMAHLIFYCILMLENIDPLNLQLQLLVFLASRETAFNW